MTPEKLSAKQILAKHGPAGWFVRSLQRYSLLGWVLFILTLGGHFLIVLLSTLAPRPVVTVDEAGRVLGTIEYLKPDARSDFEIMAEVKRFTSLYLSLNSVTIFDDYAEAMNMMGDEFLQATSASLAKSPDKPNEEGLNYLSRVAAAKARSWLEFAAQDGVVLLERRGANALVRVVGNIVIDGGSKDGPISKPFDITFSVQVVARNNKNTSGIKIISRKDN